MMIIRTLSHPNHSTSTGSTGPSSSSTAGAMTNAPASFAGRGDFKKGSLTVVLVLLVLLEQIYY